MTNLTKLSGEELLNCYDEAIRRADMVGRRLSQDEFAVADAKRFELRAQIIALIRPDGGRDEVRAVTDAKSAEGDLADAMREASSLATHLWKTYYRDDAPNWGLCDTVAGVISQIDNMTTGLRRVG